VEKGVYLTIDEAGSGGRWSWEERFDVDSWKEWTTEVRGCFGCAENERSGWGEKKEKREGNDRLEGWAMHIKAGGGD
jgi:hypothetical protein